VIQTLDSDSALVRAGGWLFQRRTSLPIPLALALLLLPASTQPGVWRWFAGGALIVFTGEAVRLWAVRHIGVVSRTRSDRLGPLISSGPFGYVRNPLYLGNMALWIGLAVSARLPWLVPVFFVLLAFEYHAIVRWEETLLESRRGNDYRNYVRRVPRWLPALRGSELAESGYAGGAPRAGATARPSSEPTASSLPPAYSWRETFFSERGTLIAIAVGYLLLWAKLLISINLAR
jgi:protein-S-isoprenylcysteine O-methyltransferase Ste14